MATPTPNSGDVAQQHADAANAEEEKRIASETSFATYHCENRAEANLGPWPE